MVLQQPTIQLKMQIKQNKGEIMAKKHTSADLKKRLETGEEALLKLQLQAEDLTQKIKDQAQKNRNLEAEYITLLLQENNKSRGDLEKLIASSPLGGN